MVDDAPRISEQPAATWTVEADATRSAQRAASIRDAVLTLAPFKQYDPAARRRNEEIGRTPGAACDSISFLAEWLELHPDDAEARRKLVDLADWTRGLQASSIERHGLSGAPSTPDLPAPRNAYSYTIDAAFCGAAMLDAHAVTGEPAYLDAARGFGDFLLHMRDALRRTYPNSKARGFCEYVVVSGGSPAYDCNVHVKNLIALPTLARLSRATGDPRYAAAAAEGRDFLVSGLDGAWEYADPASDPAVWHRVKGPRGEPQRYAYGDTLAYALRGLHEYEGASGDVRRLYSRFAAYKGEAPATRAFDGRVAFAGYMIPDLAAPDPESAYYDLVTIGILGPLRDEAARKDAARAAAFLDRQPVEAERLRWGVGFDGAPMGIRDIDLTTLTALGRHEIARGRGAAATR